MEHAIKTDNTKRRKLSSSTEESSISKHTYEFEFSKSWKSECYKIYYCRLCMYKAKNRKYMEYHRGTHKQIKNKYGNILNQHCSVVLEKFDEKPNKTGSNDTVMLNDEKILLGYKDYVVLYTPKRTKHTELDNDPESPIKTSYPRKRKRICSNSSGETVVIDNNTENMTRKKQNEKEKITNVCIQISSDEEQQDVQDGNELNISNRIRAQDCDHKTIENISSNCYSRYLKRIETTKKLPVLSSNMESQLNHKVLSIGRKVLNGNYFNCTGLLRFLEYKNLPMKWNPLRVASRDTNIVVRTSLKSNLDETSPDTNWSYITKTRSGVDTCIKQTEMTNNPDILAKNPSLRSLLICNSPIPLNTKIQQNALEIKAKILNSNPVANPKQMPSKPNRTSDSNQLPVITSTISLSLSVDKKDEENNCSMVFNEETIYPRIKVKPASELMSPTALNKLAIEKAPYGYVSGDKAISLITEKNTSIYNEVAEEVVQEGDTALQSADNNLPQVSSDISNYQSTVLDDKYVILDTVLLPNTKTKSPFHYFKNLLQCHGLIFKFEEEVIMEHYFCLIKFKVSFKQDTTEPVIFGMQLYYYNKAFCIKVKDKNQSEIAVTSLSADWQWEIMKTFKGDVLKKLLINAQKVSREAHSDTHCFMSLLSSIHMKKVD